MSEIHTQKIRDWGCSYFCTHHATSLWRLPEAPAVTSPPSSPPPLWARKTLLLTNVPEKELMGNTHCLWVDATVPKNIPWWDSFSSWWPEGWHQHESQACLFTCLHTQDVPIAIDHDHVLPESCHPWPRHSPLLLPWHDVKSDQKGHGFEACPLLPHPADGGSSLTRSGFLPGDIFSGSRRPSFWRCQP